MISGLEFNPGYTSLAQLSLALNLGYTGFFSDTITVIGLQIYTYLTWDRDEE
jgi:hypothetical protein